MLVDSEQGKGCRLCPSGGIGRFYAPDFPSKRGTWTVSVRYKLDVGTSAKLFMEAAETIVVAGSGCVDIDNLILAAP